MPAGPVTMTINYVARTGIDLASCAFTPYFNGVSLGQIMPLDYKLNQKILTTSLPAYK